jgi:hypothetical protein
MGSKRRCRNHFPARSVPSIIDSTENFLIISIAYLPFCIWIRRTGTADRPISVCVARGASSAAWSQCGHTWRHCLSSPTNRAASSLKSSHGDLPTLQRSRREAPRTNSNTTGPPTPIVAVKAYT